VNLEESESEEEEELMVRHTEFSSEVLVDEREADMSCSEDIISPYPGDKNAGNLVVLYL
jgi:hypothetical protein